MSSRPWPWKARQSIVHEPMFGIASSRFQAGSCSVRSTRPRSISRDALIIASARLPARSSAQSSAGERAASAPGVGASRSVPQALRRP
jgi:hypothetical protein